MADPKILIKGARVNNLKNIDVEIPRDKLIVVTGLSGSGKSSLAFDTLYAEGQRRYVESLSSYARQFLGRMSKPECDYILGIPPAVAIQQKVTVRNPRSTVGTSTEIYDYLRLLFARIGRTFSPVSGTEVRKHTVDDVVAAATALPEGSKAAILFTTQVPDERSLADHVELMKKNGYARAEQDGKFIRLEDFASQYPEATSVRIVVDRLKIPFEDQAAQSRFADSTEIAFEEGFGEMRLKCWLPDGTEGETVFSKHFEADGMTFEEPSDMMFNFNSPIGACPTCNGSGRMEGIDEDLVIPNKALSVAEDCVVCWRGEKMSEWKKYFISQQAPNGFPVYTPYYELTQEQKDILWHSRGEWIASIDEFFNMVQHNLYKIQYRVMLARYRGKTTCPECRGNRLRTQATYVKVGGKSITDLVKMPVSELISFFADLPLTEQEQQISKRLMAEIRNRLNFLHEVGLNYLTLDRLSNSLSGGESQRINLATSLGSSLVGSMYILDEPSIGLHPRDTDQLIHVLRQLRDLGNTVIVVEHDEEIIRSADYLIDVGPEAGVNGGEIVFQGAYPQPLPAYPQPLPKGKGEGRAAVSLSSALPLREGSRGAAVKGSRGSDRDSDTSWVERLPKEILQRSHTARFLAGIDKIPVPKTTRPWNSYIEIHKAAHNNLKGVSVKIPLGVMTVVTGVSGSGKSTLVRDILYKGMVRHLGESGDAPGAFGGFGGDLHRIAHINFVDQNPIGKSTRSNAATYLKAYDEIRRLYAEQQLSRQMGFTAATFSFNADGGRCDECKGDGKITIPMQFMADLEMTCEACHGKRFKSDVLEVKYRGKDISEVLDLSVDEAITFFKDERPIVDRLVPLQRVGLGYIKLGQSSSTLSGGENQRVKLAYYLSTERQDPTLFIFDEPTTGLHLHDVKVLLDALQSLLQRGHTIVIIEHNLDVIKCADHVIDLGPEGGAKGGNVVFEGTPRELLKCKDSYTAKYLKPKFDEN